MPSRRLTHEKCYFIVKSIVDLKHRREYSFVRDALVRSGETKEKKGRKEKERKRGMKLRDSKSHRDCKDLLCRFFSIHFHCSLITEREL